MIQLLDINKYFFRGTVNEIHALKNISIDIPSGQFVILLGSNGSGKSTLLNCIAGSVIADNGNILVDKTDIVRLSEHKRSPWISRVFQNPLSGTASELSIIENFRLASLRSQSKSLKVGIDNRFRNLVKEKVGQLNLGLEDKLDQPIGGLSGGQRQALTLLMAVMDQTKILLLDEPASALDPRTAELIMKLADQLIKEYSLTAFLVTHNLKEAMKYGDRILIMQEGSIAHDIIKNPEAELNAIQILDLF